MILNKNASGFDICMEALCSLPLDPASVPVSLLADDLGLEFAATAKILKELRERGYHVVTKNSHSEDGRVASIMGSGWVDAQADGQDYWDRVNAITPQNS